MHQTTCSIEGCDKPRHSHAGYGMCSKHYSRFAKHGDPHHVPDRFSPERVWLCVDKSGDCWLWTGAEAGGGYGSTGYDGRTVLAHRLIYTWEVGDIPEGYEVDHLCRTRLCVNPAHLEAVTPEENRRRRDAALRAESHWGDFCKRGHPLSGSNLRVRPSRPTQRGCLACEKLHRQRGKAA